MSAAAPFVRRLELEIVSNGVISRPATDIRTRLVETDNDCAVFTDVAELGTYITAWAKRELSLVGEPPRQDER